MAAAESYPDGLLYHEEHDWALIDGGEAILGITWFAQDALGDVVFVELPEVGQHLDQKAVAGVVEPGAVEPDGAFAVVEVPPVPPPLELLELLELLQAATMRSGAMARGAMRSFMRDLVVP